MYALMYIILSFVRKQFFLSWYDWLYKSSIFLPWFFSCNYQKRAYVSLIFWFSKIFQQTKTLKDNESDFVEVFYQTIKKNLCTTTPFIIKSYS